MFKKLIQNFLCYKYGKEEYMSKIEAEKQTINLMIKIYCSKHHGRKEELCDECRELRDYAFKRLDYCKFGENKGTCKNCKIHCYKPDMKIKIREVMKFSGPRLIIYSPKKAIEHIILGIRNNK